MNTHRERAKDVFKVLKPLLEAERDRIADEAAQARRDGVYAWDEVVDYLADIVVEDFWQHAYRFDEQPPDEEWGWWGVEATKWNMVSAGPDETFDTPDDLVVELSAAQLLYGSEAGDWQFWAMDNDGAVPGGGGGGHDPAPNERGEEASAGPRIRSYFPETLFVDPSIITDGSGQARIELTMADSITEWRMSALANSADGLLGSAAAGLTVFQDFFVDIDFPATLTRNDVISVPVAIYNYLDIPQTVTLTAQSADWLELLNGGSVTVPLDAGEVDAIYFDVRVTEVGTHGLTVVAEGSAMSDGIRRTVLVVPDGKEFIDTVSARFHTMTPAELPAEETVTKVVPIPEANIDGAQQLLVKVYPGFFSQCVEGLDSMLRLPSG